MYTGAGVERGVERMMGKRKGGKTSSWALADVGDFPGALLLKAGKGAPSKQAAFLPGNLRACCNHLVEFPLRLWLCRKFLAAFQETQLLPKEITQVAQGQGRYGWPSSSSLPGKSRLEGLALGLQLCLEMRSGGKSQKRKKASLPGRPSALNHPVEFKGPA